MFLYRQFLFPKEDYPENWDELRKAVYRRDGWQCQKCGAKNTQLHAHHLITLSDGGSNEMDNLITLCKNCHIDDHPHMWWGRWKENNPQIILALRIVAMVLFLISLVVFGFSWWYVLVLIIALQPLS